MDRVQSDKDKNLEVVAYESISIVIQTESEAELHKGNAKFGLTFVERFKFYDLAKDAFCIVQTTDTLPYANVLVSKGVL